MKVSRILIATSLVFLATSCAALPAFAATAVGSITSGLTSAAGGAGYGSTAVTAEQLPVIVGSIINILLQLVGVLLLVYLIYAGFLWMTAGGDKTKVEKATLTIRNAIIGLVIIILAYSIAGYVVSELSTVASGGGAGTQATP